MSSTSQVMDRVRRALGRDAPLDRVPAPPVIDESFARLVGGDADLPRRFLAMCEENKMHAEATSAADLAAHLAEFLRMQKVRRVALAAGGVLGRLKVADSLRQAGFECKSWDQMTLEELYDFDCGITGVDYAVAETGSLVVRASADHGRGLSLVPAIHVAVVEPGQIAADLIDLFALLGREGTGSAVSLITGPSKTSDIEMNLVVGVHGPMQVQVFLVG